MMSQIFWPYANSSASTPNTGNGLDSGKGLDSVARQQSVRFQPEAAQFLEFFDAQPLHHLAPAGCCESACVALAQISEPGQ